MKVVNNQATFLPNEQTSSIVAIEISTQIDIMLECPGVLLSQGSQRFFTKAIQTLKPRPYRKTTFVNLFLWPLPNSD
jgi:hypothetical protein